MVIRPTLEKSKASTLARNLSSAAAALSSLEAASRTTNSSPPKRTSLSVSRSVFVISRTTSIRISSP
jgi:hypothetical protein